MQAKRLSLLVVILLTLSPIFSQEKESKLNVFLNCNFCDQSYIKQNLEHAEFVRDQNYADVYLFFTNQRNGSGGRVYEIDIVGQNKFKEFKDKIIFSTNSNNTSDEVRALMLKNIRLGLIRYWVKEGLQDKISISIKRSKPEELVKEKDPWNNWIFELEARGNFNGHETYSKRNLNFNTSARRITEKNKFIFRLRYGNDESIYKFDGNPDQVYNNSNKNITLYNVFSINSHWSAGIFSWAGCSDYSNKDLYITLAPAIEYNFFDYKESFKKQITLAYRLGYNYTNYTETTVFGKNDEYLWNHSLSLKASVRQVWGNINGSVRYESYLHDTALNQFSFNLGARVRLFKGFSFNVGGNYNITNNQINLPAGNLTVEEILLQQQQIKSGYNYRFNIGFSYTFGSMFNTVVNPRFD
jgi:hypothetical protein